MTSFLLDDGRLVIPLLVETDETLGDGLQIIDINSPDYIAWLLYSVKATAEILKWVEDGERKAHNG